MAAEVRNSSGGQGGVAETLNRDRDSHTQTLAKCELRSANCEAQSAKLRSAKCETANCELRSAKCERTAKRERNCEARTAKVRSADCNAKRDCTSRPP